MSPPRAPPPPGGGVPGAGSKITLGKVQHGKRNPGPRHDPATCATCSPRTLGPVRRTSSIELRQRATRSETGITYVGSPARMVAGQILSGDKYCWEIADDLVELLGPTTSLTLASSILRTAAGDPL